jgi:hypothetical protein
MYYIYNYAKDKDKVKISIQIFFYKEISKCFLHLYYNQLCE